MPNEEWGVKRICPTTGKRFYDLKKTPVISPFTGEVVEIEPPGRKGTAQLQSENAKAKAKAAAAELDTDDDLLEDEDVAVDSDDDLLEDEDDDTVSFDELSDVASNDEDV